MIRFKTMRLCLVIAAVALVIAPGAVRAMERVTGPAAVIPRDRVVQDDVLIGGNNVQVEGLVNGDVMAAGTNVLVSGVVRDDVLAAGATVNITGPVGHNLRAVGGTVRAAGNVQRNAVLAGGTVVLAKGASIGGDANLAGGTVEVNARIARDLAISAGEARIASEVGGSLEARADKLVLLPGAVVQGNLVAYGSSAPVISRGARVLGRMEYHPVVTAQPASPVASWLGNWAFRFAAFLLFAWALVAIAPRWVGRVSQVVGERSAPAVVAGFLGLAIVPAVCFLLGITVVGLPLSLSLLALYTIAVLMSGIFVSYLAGEWLLIRLNRAAASNYTRMAVGVLAVSFLTTLPGLGWIFQAIVVMLGFGAALLERGVGIPWSRRQPTVGQAVPAGGVG